MTLANHPPHDRWHNWTELDAKAWPERKERNYTIVPTTCFNCEAACGLTAFIDNETGEIAKFEGNPEHPASRGRNCAKGPATLNQVDDPERVLYPMKRSGATRQRPVGADLVGSGTRRDRRPDPQGPARGPHQRGDVPRRAPRRGRLHRAGAQGVGSRRPQQPHQHLLVERPDRLPVVDGPRPPLERLRQRRSGVPDLCPPRGGPLLQPACTADHGGQGEGRHRDLRRPAPVEHRRQGRLLARHLAGNRAVPDAGDRPAADRERHVAARLRAALGELGDLSRRDAS